MNALKDLRRLLAGLALALALGAPAHALTPAQRQVLIGDPCGGVAPSATFAGAGPAACYNNAPKPSFTAIPGYSFTRASQETCTDASTPPLITYAANNVPCVNSAGYATWQAATNLALWSQDVSQAGSWSSTYASIAGGQSAPDGTTTGQNLVEGASTQSWRLFQSYTKAASAIAYTRTQIIKPGGRTSLYVRDDDGTTTNCVFVAYSLSGSGSIGTAATVAGTWTSPSATIKALSGGYYLVTLTFTTGTGTTLRDLYGSNDGSAATVNTPSIAGINATAFTDWAHQLETGSFPTPYVPTTSASATRAADVMSFARGIGMQGTVVVKYLPNAPPGNFGVFRSAPVSAGSYLADNALAANTGWFASSPGGLSNATAGVINKDAITFNSSGSFRISRNGAAVASSAASDYTGGGTSIDLGRTSTTNQLNGNITSFVLYSQMKADGALRALTQ